MRETKFIEQNKEKWKAFERLIRTNKKDPEKLSKLFVQITDDLSYSRTFYPNRSVRVYLNNLAQQVFYSIYKNKRTGKNRFTSFWSEELPRLLWEARKELWLSAFVFLLAFVIGLISSFNDPEFLRTILGDRYVDMTIANIQNNDPMAVYKQQNEVDMSFGITFNNATVAFLTFMYGALFAIGSIAVMIQNGVMVGAFHGFMYNEGVIRETLLTVWIHGTLEISAIILAGMAGLTMGKGLIFPGTFTRIQAFQLSAKRGLKIMVGILPIIILAGFIEGFVTRYTDAPDVLRLGIILASLSFVLIYFLWYPWVKSKEGFVPLKASKLPPTRNQKIDFGKIKTGGELFTDTFIFYRSHFKKLARVVILGSLAYCGILLLLDRNTLSEDIFYTQWSFLGSFIPPNPELIADAIAYHFQNITQLFSVSNWNILTVLNSFFFGAICYFTCLFLSKDIEGINYKRTTGNHIIGYLQVVAIFALIFSFYIPLEIGAAIFWLSLLSPFFLLWAFIIVKEKRDIFTALGVALQMFFKRLFGMLGTFWSMLIIAFLFSFFIGSDFLWRYVDMISWNFKLDAESANLVLSSFVVVLFTTVLGLLLPILVSNMGIYYASVKEINNANSLSEKVKYIGMKRRIKGMEREG